MLLTWHVGPRVLYGFWRCVDLVWTRVEYFDMRPFAWLEEVTIRENGTLVCYFVDFQVVPFML